MLKKILISAPFALCFSSVAHAEDYAYIPYIGLDYGYINAHAAGTKPTYQAGGINIGTKYNDFFGTELFFQQTGSDSKKIADGKYKSSFRAYGLDIAAYLPLGCEHRLDIFATTGIGEYVFNKKFTGDKHHNDSGYGYRFGSGLMFNLDENISFRAAVRYVNLDKISGYDHMMEYSAGIRYHFNKD